MHDLATLRARNEEAATRLTAASSVDKIIAYENGELSDDETVALFQALVNSGLAWQLQGHYGRTAMRLIETGLVHKPS